MTDTIPWIEECPFCDDAELSTRIAQHVWNEHQTEINWAANRLNHYTEGEIDE